MIYDFFFLLIMKIVPEKYKSRKITKALVGVMALIISFLVGIPIVVGFLLVIESIYGSVPDWMLSFGM